MPLAERMKLAEGRPLRRSMMAAMAQQDCGQCGYNCEDYADALFAKKEERLNLCVPGGKETARMLKALLRGDRRRAGAAPPKAPTRRRRPPTRRRPTPARSRDNPVEATLRLAHAAQQAGLREGDLAHRIRSRRMRPRLRGRRCLRRFIRRNDPALVDAVLAALDAPPDFPIGGRTLREVLIDGVSLSPAPDMLFQLFSYITGGERRQKAKALAAGEDPDGDAATLDVLAALEKFPGVRPDPEAFIEALDPLQPRLYSISSSPQGRSPAACRSPSMRCATTSASASGSASPRPSSPTASSRATSSRSMCRRRTPSACRPIPTTPIIMVGPGTGVAPFRAFLHERMATKAPGRNWLFFGHQRRDYDFFYEDELTGMKAAGVLTRLSLAWSRDGDEKFYVQDRMREVGRDLWAWLADGAHVYVCGDAKRMAKDVERALVDIVAQHGARSTDEAIAFVAELKKSGRYQTDVY